MLSALFNPQSIAVIGASADAKKVGHAVLQNLIQYHYQGRLIPVNPSCPEILVLKTYPKVSTAEVRTDLAIVAGQRAIRHARTLDVPGATALAAAALAQPQRPVLARLGERAAELLARSQRPDGTFEGGQAWTLQRVLGFGQDRCHRQ